MSNRRLVLALCSAALLAACATPAPAPVSVADTIARDPQLSTLNGLVQKAGLADTLKGTGPFTVFAPNNDAFKAVSAKTMDELGRDPAKLKSVRDATSVRLGIDPGFLCGRSTLEKIAAINPRTSA